MKELRKFLCGHDEPAKRVGYRELCPTCGSFWDPGAASNPFAYDDSYSKLRNHLDPTIGALKIRSIDAWLKQCEPLERKLVVCEVGFGGGHSLVYLQQRFDYVFGIEVIEANLQNAAQLGVSQERLLHAESLPTSLPKKVDLWCFFDSFEHLPNPGEFADWLLANSSPSACVIVVAPCAGSLSDRLLGSFWPHRLRDHPFHWSKTGLKDFFAKYDFAAAVYFRPQKFIELPMVVAHLCHKARCEWMMPYLLKFTPKLPLSLNFGELGVMFRRGRTSA